MGGERTLRKEWGHRRGGIVGTDIVKGRWGIYSLNKRDVWLIEASYDIFRYFVWCLRVNWLKEAY